MNDSNEMIEIDGSTGAGGGQILRIALAMSSILSKPFKIINIRSKRPNPGLGLQHLAGVRAMAELTDATVTGAELNSTELSFFPKKIKAGNYKFVINSAGSITLLAQSLVPVLLFGESQSKITLTGGTHSYWAPNIDEYSAVFLPLIKLFGAEVSLSVKKLGWFPKGNGEVVFTISPSKLVGKKFTEKGEPGSIHAICSLSNLNPEILEREEQGIKEIFPNVQVRRMVSGSLSPGTSVSMWANFENTIIGSAALGKIGLRAENLGKNVANDLKKTISTDSTVDRWIADQLLIFMALAKGKSSIIVPELTAHIKTCSWLIPMFTNTPFQIEGNKITIDGIGE